MTKRMPPLHFRNMHAALEAKRRAAGKATQSRHYINENRLIRYAVTGSCMLCVKNQPVDPMRARLIRQVIRHNISLIWDGLPYPERKVACRNFFLDADKKPHQMQ